MEKLEITLEEVSVEEGKEGKALNPLYNTGYEGLKLMSEKVHAGGTGIKYWM
jgi:hypothetical protein